jgi:hypothetical protein
MAQSSALRREDANPAPTPITIDGNLVPKPNPAGIRNDGSVTFTVAKACWLYFSPLGVFGDSQGILKLVTGKPNGPYDPEQANVTVTYCVTDPNTTCAPAPASVSSTKAGGPPMDGGNTIKVG